MTVEDAEHVQLLYGLQLVPVIRRRQTPHLALPVLCDGTVAVSDAEKLMPYVAFWPETSSLTGTFTEPLQVMATTVAMSGAVVVGRGGAEGTDALTPSDVGL